MIEPLRVSVEVACEPEHAFGTWTARFGTWWPRGHTVSAGSVEAWARHDANPVGGWYGLRKGYRGRFANYVPPVLEHLGLAEVEHGARNNRMRSS
ncbi:MAG: DUF6855 family protein [Acidimicrobiales bacterium]